MPRKYTPRQPRVTRTCQHCDVSFSITAARFRSGDGAYCSPPCRKAAIAFSPERFWARGRKTESGCLVWTGALNNKGYGQLTILYKRYLAHRIAFELAKGPISNGMEICHRCDNPPCYEPAHLFAATHRENGLDMSSKGRAALQRHPHLIRWGEDAPAARLNPDRVREIRQQRKSGMTLKAIAEIHGINLGTVWQVANRKTWDHVE